MVTGLKPTRYPSKNGSGVFRDFRTGHNCQRWTGRIHAEKGMADVRYIRLNIVQIHVLNMFYFCLKHYSKTFRLLKRFEDSLRKWFGGFWVLTCIKLPVDDNLWLIEKSVKNWPFVENECTNSPWFSFFVNSSK